MESQTYNGWTNYETWVVRLWLDNAENTHLMMHEFAKEAWEQAPQSRSVREWKFSREDAAIRQLADEIREFLEEHNPISEASVYADLMNAALSEVNWREIAMSYLDDQGTEPKEDERKAAKEQEQDEHRTENDNTK